MPARREREDPAGLERTSGPALDGEGAVPPSAKSRLDRPADQIVEDFTKLYYQQPAYWHDTMWLGVHCVKSPLELWVYQEILDQTRPELIVETGTYFGGSAWYMASILDLIGSGTVISIDIEPVRRDAYPEHPRISYWGGRSSVAEDLVEEIHETAAQFQRVMVVLDSDHQKHHVVAELEGYAPVVTPGCYLICEDTSANGHPIFPEHGPGPMEAVHEWLPRQGGRWEVDRSREKFLMTFNPGGYLRKVS